MIKPYLLPVLLQILGVLTIMAEIFIPSMGLLTVIALGLFGYSLYAVYTGISVTAGMVFTAIDLVLVPVLIYIGIRILGQSKLSLKRELSRADGVAVQAQDYTRYLGMRGRAVTDLRPAGMAQIDSQRLDVVTDGEYIEAETPVKVKDVTGNQIIVETDAKEAVQ